MNTFDAVLAGAPLDWDGPLPGPLGRLRGCAQTPEVHGEGDVAAHTELVLAELDHTAARPGPFAGVDAAALLRAGAVLHDVGKPDTTREIRPGCFAAPGHAEAGARIVAELFASDPALHARGPRFAAAVHALVRDHMWVWDPDQVSPGAMIRMTHLVDPEWLTAIWAADTRGRVCADAEGLAHRVDYAREVLADRGCDTPSAWPHVADPSSLDPATARELLREIVEGRVTSPGAAAAFAASAARAGRAGSLTYTIGLPGSGKSTWAAAWADRTGGVVLSADGRRQRDRMRAHGQLRAELPGLLRAGAHVLIDATHTDRASRDRWLAAAATYRSPVHAVWFDAPLTECVRRQSTRAWDQAVPVDVIVEMARRRRFPTPDEYATLTVVDAAGQTVETADANTAPTVVPVTEGRRRDRRPPNVRIR